MIYLNIGIYIFSIIISIDWFFNCFDYSNFKHYYSTAGEYQEQMVTINQAYPLLQSTHYLHLATTIGDLLTIATAAITATMMMIVEAHWHYYLYHSLTITATEYCSNFVVDKQVITKVAITAIKMGLFVLVASFIVAMQFTIILKL